MPFPFPKIQPKSYLKTFIKSVSLELQFQLSDALKPDEDLRKELHSFFLTLFKDVEDPGFTPSREETTITYNRRTVELNLRPTMLRLKLRFPAYISYSNLESYLPHISRYLEIIKVDEVTRIKLIKYNELGFKMNPRQSDLVGVMKGLFSNPLVTDWKEIKGSLEKDTELTRWERTLTVDSETMTGKISYGFKLKETDPSIGALPLRISMESAPDSNPVKIEKMSETLEDYNIWCDSAFDWSITPEIKRQMSIR